MNPMESAAWLDDIAWDERGLVMAIAQDAVTHRVLMVAWMNRESLEETARTGRAVYFSRSRGRLWRKGEESGHQQKVSEIRLDCDGDVILLMIEQVGGIACHTGRESCMYRRLEPQGQGGADAGGRWVWHAVDPVLKDPEEIYSSKKP